MQKLWDYKIKFPTQVRVVESGSVSEELAFVVYLSLSRFTVKVGMVFVVVGIVLDLIVYVLEIVKLFKMI